MFRTLEKAGEQEWNNSGVPIHSNVYKCRKVFPKTVYNMPFIILDALPHLLSKISGLEIMVQGSMELKSF